PADRVTVTEDVEIHKNQPDAEQPRQRDFEDLTLAELVDRLVRRPRETFRALTRYVDPDNVDEQIQSIRIAERAIHERVSPVRTVPLRELVVRRDWLGNVDLLQLGLYIVSFFLVVFGCAKFVSGAYGAGRSEDIELADGLPWIIIGLVLWGFAEL